MAGFFRSVLLAEKFPVIVAISFASVLWCVKYLADRWAETPFIEYTQTIRKAGVEKLLLYQFQNITPGIRFENTEVSFYKSPDTIGVLSCKIKPLPGTKALRDAENGLLKNGVFQVPELQPGWGYAVEMKLSGDIEKFRFVFSNPSQAMSLSTSGLATIVLKHESHIVISILVIWGVLSIFSLGYYVKHQ